MENLSYRYLVARYMYGTSVFKTFQIAPVFKL